MKTRFRRLHRQLAVILILAFFFMLGGVPVELSAAADIRLVVDGQSIRTTPLPLIQAGRTLVPVRVVSEQLGAQVDWNADERTVHIVKGSHAVKLRIDSRLVEYGAGEKSYDLCDVPPQIIGDRTFVPLRLVSNALGVAVSWEDATRTVRVDSSRKTERTSFFNMKISSVQDGQAINGAVSLQAVFPNGIPAGAAEIKYMLLSPENGRGRVVARGGNITGAYLWLPDAEENGKRVLAAAVYDAGGGFLAGDAINVQMAVAPRVSLSSPTAGQVITGGISLAATVNFNTAYVKYEITNLTAGKVSLSPESDPYGAYSWTPMMEDNGSFSFRAIAYDKNGQAYPSQPVMAQVAVTRQLSLRGITAGSTIEKPVTLWVSRNFNVLQTDYILRDPRTGLEETLAVVEYANYEWFPRPDQAGVKELLVRVKDTRGVVHTSDSISVVLTGSPKLILRGVGPEQVVTGAVKLTALSNTTLANIKYYLINPKTGAKRIIAQGTDARAEYTWTPAAGDEGNWTVQAEGATAQGVIIASEKIPIRVYLGKIYSAQPVVAKDKFLDLASGLAVKSWQTTGMSAALQTAQAILETGWGQSVPVDKYTGTMSNNLFGIKGKGTVGSVISNTWEEYNGISFRIDAEFRAYKNVTESWADHKKLLLTASRYEPFRNVMHDCTQGAWALKRAGYATDSQYPLKLMDLIKRYDLQKLDETGI
jgi:hypothetical protein